MIEKKMVNYDVEVSPEFLEHLKKLQRNLQERVKKILRQLPSRNWKKDALKGDLNGFYSHHFEKNRYRIIYRVEEHIFKILAIYVGKRDDDFYKTLKEYLKRTKQL